MKVYVFLESQFNCVCIITLIYYILVDSFHSIVHNAIGPGALEALANGCVFIQPKFEPPRNKYNEVIFR